MKKYYTVKEAAKILGFSTNTIYKYLDEGSLKGRRLGGRGRFKIPHSEIAPYLTSENPAPKVVEKTLAQATESPQNKFNFFELFTKTALGFGVIYFFWTLAFMNLSSDGKVLYPEYSMLFGDVAASTIDYSERTFSETGNLAKTGVTGLAGGVSQLTALVSKLKPQSPTPQSEEMVAELVDSEIVNTDKEADTKAVMVNVPNGTYINIREEPSTESAIIAKLDSSEVVGFVDENDGWTKVVFRNLFEGWVDNGFIEETTLAYTGNQVIGVADEPGVKRVVISETPTGWLRVRGTPGGDEIGKVYPGESYVLTDTVGEWLLIEVPQSALTDNQEASTTKPGWISSQYALIEQEE